MEFTDIIKARHSYRGNYKPDKVPREHLEMIMRAGLAAPSGCNKQTVYLIAVDDPELLGRLKAALDPAFGLTAPAFVCVLTKAVPCYRGKAYNVQDYSAAIENMLLAITDLGYASCWYEGYVTNGQDVPAAGKLAEILGVPEGYEMVCVLPVGIPAELVRAVKKVPFEERAGYNSFPGK